MKESEQTKVKLKRLTVDEDNYSWKAPLEDHFESNAMWEHVCNNTALTELITETLTVQRNVEMMYFLVCLTSYFFLFVVLELQMRSILWLEQCLLGLQIVRRETLKLNFITYCLMVVSLNS